MSLPERGLVHVELIGVDGALYDVLPQPVGARHKDDVPEARLRVEGEDHAARGEVRAHHLHDAHRERDLEVVEALVDPVGDGAIEEERREAAAAGVEQHLVTADIQEGLVLPGEARGGEVFGRGSSYALPR